MKTQNLSIVCRKISKYAISEAENREQIEAQAEFSNFNAVLPINSNKLFFDTLFSTFMTGFPQRCVNLFIVGPRKSGKSFTLYGSEIHGRDSASIVLGYKREKGLFAYLMNWLNAQSKDAQAVVLLTVLEIGAELTDLLRIFNRRPQCKEQARNSAENRRVS